MNNVPLHVHTTFSLVKCQWTFGCFHIFAVVNNATMNTGIQVSEFLLSIPFGIYLELKCWITW